MNLNLIDIITVGMPETILCLMIGIYIFEKKETLSTPSVPTIIVILLTLGVLSWAKLIHNTGFIAGSVAVLVSLVFVVVNRSMDRKKLLQVTLVSILVILVANFTRSRTSNILIVMQTSVLSITLFSAIVFKWSLRKAYLAASFAIYLVATAEIVGVDIAFRILSAIGSEELLTSSKFYVSLPTRIVQITAIVGISKLKVNYSNLHIINSKMSDLETQEIKTLTSIMLTITSANLLISNYIDIMINLNNNGIARQVLELNLNIILIVTIFFIWLTGFSLNRSMRLEHAEAENASYIELFERRRNNEKKRNVS